MPTPTEIVAMLGRMAHDGFGLAVLWHALVAAALVALARGYRPSQRTAARALVPLLVSVSAAAWAYGNPFNGLLFAAAAVALGVLAQAGPARTVALGPWWAAIAGGAVMAFGLFYPHFLSDRPFVAYLYGAPLGLVPCPTLAFAIGVTLACGGFGRRGYALALALLGVFYALFGWLRLGVTLDLGLLVGALALLGLVAAQARGERPAHRSASASGTAH